jgi:DNA invertase Pin-like site-specific DNA recombinase
MKRRMAAQQEHDILSTINYPIGLLRISTDKTDFSGKKVAFEETLKNHEEKMTNFFDQQEWEKNFYKEVLSGGTEYEQRPELMAVVEKINQGKCDVIVVMELQRLSRQGYVSQVIKKAVEKFQVLIITLNPFKIYDVARNMNDSFLFDITASMGEHERKVASARVKANKISMARQGLNSSGSVPYGYVRNPQTKKLEIEFRIDENGNKVETEKAGIVRQIFKWYLDGEGQRSICDRLNDMGIRNKQGNLWVPNSLRYLLTCQTYIGTLVAKNFENEKGKMVPTETVVKPNNHPAIIDLETWNKSQALRNNKRDRSGIDQRSKDWNSKKNMSILDGLVYCTCCGRKSTIKWYKDKGFFYIIKCSRFDANGLTCNNGGASIKMIEADVFDKILSYKEEIQKRIHLFEGNDFGTRLADLETQKEMLERHLEELKLEFMTIRNQEKNYERQKQKTGIADEFEEEMIQQDKEDNSNKRMHVNQKLAEVIQKLESTPSADDEIKKLKNKLDIIQELENREDLTPQLVNVLLKQIILKVHYKRELPTNFRNLSQKVRDEEYPPQLEIEYID